MPWGSQVELHTHSCRAGLVGVWTMVMPQGTRSFSKCGPQTPCSELAGSCQLRGFTPGMRRNTSGAGLSDLHF